MATWIIRADDLLSAHPQNSIYIHIRGCISFPSHAFSLGPCFGAHVSCPALICHFHLVVCADTMNSSPSPSFIILRAFLILLPTPTTSSTLGVNAVFERQRSISSPDVEQTIQRGIFGDPLDEHIHGRTLSCVSLQPCACVCVRALRVCVCVRALRWRVCVRALRWRVCASR